MRGGPCSARSVTANGALGLASRRESTVGAAVGVGGVAAQPASSSAMNDRIIAGFRGMVMKPVVEKAVGDARPSRGSRTGDTRRMLGPGIQ